MLILLTSENQLETSTYIFKISILTKVSRDLNSLVVTRLGYGVGQPDSKCDLSTVRP